MTPESRLTVERDGVRLDKLVADWRGCGRRAARALVRDGRVLVDGRRLPAAVRPRRGSTLELLPAAAPRQTERAAATVLWQDDQLVAIAKPAGLHTVGGRCADSAQALLETLDPAFARVREASGDSAFVHRLDRDTSGVVLAARDVAAWREMRAAFSQHRVRKEYLAIVDGDVQAALHIDTPLARRRTRVVAARRRDRALPALTHVEPLQDGTAWSLVRISMLTGVTHQIRAHLALVGHPIVGDLKYGRVPAPAGTRHGQLLHACRIAVAGRLDVLAPVPHDFEAALADLRSQGATRRPR